MSSQQGFPAELWRMVVPRMCQESLVAFSFSLTWGHNSLLLGHVMEEWEAEILRGTEIEYVIKSSTTIHDGTSFIYKLPAFRETFENSAYLRSQVAGLELIMSKNVFTNISKDRLSHLYAIFIELLSTVLPSLLASRSPFSVMMVHK